MPAPLATIFHGTATEALELIRAIEANCACAKTPMGAIVGVCGAHQLMRDQRLIDHAVFARRLRERWLAEEGV